MLSAALAGSFPSALADNDGEAVFQISGTSLAGCQSARPVAQTSVTSVRNPLAAISAGTHKQYELYFIPVSVDVTLLLPYFSMEEDLGLVQW